MAHGFFRETRHGHLMIGHGGDTIVFHTEFDLFPDDGVGIMYTFNSRGREDAVYGAREALLEGFMDRYFPAAAASAQPPALGSAVADAQQIAGRYESSRRIEHGFMSILYVLHQSVIAANPDGTISAPGLLGPEPVVFREIAPQLWREVGGKRQLALRTIRGVKSVLDSSDPASVLQIVPLKRSAPLNLAVLFGSGLVLIGTLLALLLSPWVRPPHNIPTDVVPQFRRLRLYLRCAAAFDALYLVAWFMLIRPILSSQVEFYSSSIDAVVSVLQLAGLLAMAAAGLALLCAWRLSRLAIPVKSRVPGIIVALGALGVVWIGFIGGLFKFSLNY